MLCLEQAASWLQGKQVKASGDMTQSQASKVTARNFLGPREACRVCQKPKNNSADRNNEIDPPLNSAKTPYTIKIYWTPSTEKKLTLIRYLFLERMISEMFFSVLAIIPLTSLISFCQAKKAANLQDYGPTIFVHYKHWKAFSHNFRFTSTGIKE